MNASRVVKAFVTDIEIVSSHTFPNVYNLFTKAENCCLELTGHAVYHVLSRSDHGSDRKANIIAGTMETSELTSVIVYALQIIGSLMMVTFVFVMIS